MSQQIVYLHYRNTVEFEIPKGIDLEDKETYSYHDKWGTLYIKNLKTGEEIELEAVRGDGEEGKKYAEDTEIDYIWGSDDEKAAASKKEALALIAEIKASEPKGFVSNFTRCKKLEADVEKRFSEGLLTDPKILMDLLTQAMFLVIEAKSSFEADEEAVQATRQALEFWTSL